MSEISCEEVLKQIDFYLTVELPAEEIDQIAGHLVDCGSCDDRVKLHLRLREVIARKCGETAAPDTLLTRVRSMLEERHQA